MENSIKFKIADQIAAAIKDLPSFKNFANKAENEQYYLVLNVPVSGGLTIPQKWEGDDGLHIAFLVKRRLSQAPLEGVDLDL